MATKTHSSVPSQPDKVPSLKKEFLLFMSIPIIIIILVAIVLAVPGLLAKPHYDFIYSDCPDYDCASSYSLSGSGKIIQTELKQDDYYQATQPVLYEYDAAHNSSKRIDLAQAQALVLDNSNVSPDGYILTQNNASGGFLFWDDSGDGSWYLKNGFKKKQVNVVTDGSYDQTVNFLGWVK